MKYTKKYINDICRVARLTCLMICLAYQPAISQSEPPPPVEEVVLDSVSFKNGDTSVEELNQDETEYHDETISNDSVTENVIFRSVPDSVTNNLKSDKKFEYANDPEYWVRKNEEIESSSNRNNWGNWFKGLQVFMYIILVAALVFLIYRIIVNNNLFYRRSRKVGPLHTIDESEDITDENIDQKIEQAIAASNYRLATRYLHIKTLKRLDERGLIRYHSQATNYDYLNQIAQYKSAEDFAFVTRIYEYVWYGEFDMNTNQFEITKSVFDRIFKEVK